MMLVVMNGLNDDLKRSLTCCRSGAIPQLIGESAEPEWKVFARRSSKRLFAQFPGPECELIRLSKSSLRYHWYDL